MEFEGKQIAPQEIPENFLDEFPFHRNNGTLKAMRRDLGNSRSFLPPQ